MTINTYFDKTYCINLEKRSDKWSDCLSEFAKYDISIDRFNGVDGNLLPKHGTLMPGELGCLLSHKAVLEDIVANNYQRVLVLEDDVQFVRDFNNRFQEAVPHIPTKWDMLYFGGNHLLPVRRLNNFISKIAKTYTTSSYGISNSMARRVLNTFDMNPQIDVLYAKHHPNNLCYIFDPVLAWQRPSHSDIHNVYVDYTPAMKPPGE